MPGNLIATLLVARALYAPSTFAFAPKRGEVKYSKEWMRWVEKSIGICHAAEPVELIEAVLLFYNKDFMFGIQFVVKKLRKASTREEKRRKDLPLKLKHKILHEILRRLRYLGRIAIPLNNEVCVFAAV
ncbi:unnamed protein product [Urochloa humidicola]